MHRSIHGSAPPRGPAGGQPRYGTQDARGNLAVPPTVAPAKVSLKKAAVKVVRPSGTPATATPSAAPVKMALKLEEGYGSSVYVTASMHLWISFQRRSFLTSKPFDASCILQYC
jgi:hypothetical protein